MSRLIQSMNKFGFALISMLLVSACSQSEELSPLDAKDYIGEIKTVCGQVSSVSNIGSSKNIPVLVNLGPAYPSQVFTIVIWKEWQEGLDVNLSEIRDRTVCVKGMIGAYRDIPQIEINQNSKLWIESNEYPEPVADESAKPIMSFKYDNAIPGDVEASPESRAVNSTETNKSLNFENTVTVVETKNLSILVSKVSSEMKAFFWVIPSSMPKDCLFSGLLVNHQDNSKEFIEVPVVPVNAGLDGTALTFLVSSEGVDLLQGSKQIAVNVCGNWIKLKDEHVANIRGALN